MHYIERDISWLAFNGRVLQEAADASVPLYERLKFLAIFSSNLNEFYRVRVSSMRSFKELSKEERPKEIGKPKKILKEVRRIIQRQQKEFGRIFLEEIRPALRTAGIEILSLGQLSEDHLEFVLDYFDQSVSGDIDLVYLKTGEELFLEDKQLYLVIDWEEEDTIPILKIPSEEYNRFVKIPGASGLSVAFLDDIVRLNLEKVLNHSKINGAYAIKVSRDAELYVDDEFSGNLIEKLKSSLAERKKGRPTRFLYDPLMPPVLLKRLRKIFGISKYDVTPGYTYHNFHDYFSFPKPEKNPDLFDEPLPPLDHPTLDRNKPLLPQVAKQDFLLNFPYQKFDYVVSLLSEAASDPEVIEIKITFYRLASDSKIANMLLKALNNGKNVVVFIEAKARFDEESNMNWGEKLEQAGATVIYSYPGIKVHTKLFLIRKSDINYAYLGTGNFNEKTALLYADHALITSDQDLTHDVDMVFQILEKKLIIPRTREAFISPFHTRSRFEELIDREISLAKEGKRGFIFLKMNSLEDRKMINKLYQASQAGVEIKCIVRGFCCMVPGVEGVSDHIEAISIVDRFLEHARVYIFGNDENEQMYLASADWMTRNLDRRIEIVFPVKDQKIFDEIRHIIDLQWSDNIKARIIDAYQSNNYREKTEDPLRSQTAIYDFLKTKKRQKEISDYVTEK